MEDHFLEGRAAHLRHGRRRQLVPLWPELVADAGADAARAAAALCRRFFEIHSSCSSWTFREATNDDCFTLPASTTKTTSGIVTEVSATLVATTTFRPPPAPARTLSAAPRCPARRRPHRRLVAQRRVPLEHGGQPLDLAHARQEDEHRAVALAASITATAEDEECTTAWSNP